MDQNHKIKAFKEDLEKLKSICKLDNFHKRVPKDRIKSKRKGIRSRKRSALSRRRRNTFQKMDNFQGPDNKHIKNEDVKPMASRKRSMPSCSRKKPGPNKKRKNVEEIVNVKIFAEWQ